MLILDCPFCGARPEGEFVCLGEATPPRPHDPAALSVEEWVDFVCFRANVRGPHQERWWHARGCGTIFTVTRNTQTHEVLPAAEGRAP